ncbi:hypothetical protein K449DRAFT_429883 [Hypoxylon sp. EC38]|nr:hypothetical protein K449DRAFT_429883 [Hypoxylon sp. EC38]
MKPVRTAQYRWPNWPQIILLLTHAGHKHTMGSSNHPLSCHIILLSKRNYAPHGMSSTHGRLRTSIRQVLSPPRPVLCAFCVRWREGGDAVPPWYRRAAAASCTYVWPQYGSLRDREEIQPNNLPSDDIGACAPRGLSVPLWTVFGTVRRTDFEVRRGWSPLPFPSFVPPRGPLGVEEATIILQPCDGCNRQLTLCNGRRLRSTLLLSTVLSFLSGDNADVGTTAMSACGE